MIKYRRLAKSFFYSYKGILRVFREEQNIKIQIILAIAVIALGLFFKISLLEWCILIIVITLVILAEIINSAVERITDMFKPRIHEYVKVVKDITAGAVMITAISAMIVGVLIFYPYFSKFLLKN
jgi:undecaprenol kinase